MIEVFRTNVNSQERADVLIDRIHEYFEGYQANFDLDDCDRILRVHCAEGLPEACSLISFLAQQGCIAEVLPDTCESTEQFLTKLKTTPYEK